MKESESIEFKSIINSDFKKEVVAFANTRGGILYIGINDDGQVIGVENPEQLCASISSMLRDGVKPDLTMFISISVDKMDNKSVVKIIIQRGTKRPYYLNDKGLKSSGVFVRLGNTSVPASENAIRSMIGENDGIDFESMRSMNQDLTFKMAELEFAKHNLKIGIAQQKSLGLQDSDGLFTNLGLLLSDQCQHSIKAAVFKGLEKDEFISRKEFNGSLFEQLNDAYDFIDLNNRLNSTFEGLTRVDRRDYSEAAIREALLNAIIHRDYAFSGSTLISIFSDKLEFVSLGGLVAGLEPEDIFEGISQTRNTGLANVFYRLNFVEAYGTGIRKIRNECEKYGVTAEFHITNAAFRVVIPSRHSTPLILRDLQEPLHDIIKFIRINKIVTRQDVQNAFGLKQTKCGLLLKELENRHQIIKRGAGKATTYSIAKSYPFT